MPLELNSGWTRSPLILKGKEVDAYRKDGIDLDADYKWIKANWDVLAKGSVLVRNEHDVGDRQEIALPGGIVGYRSSLPKSDIWYFPQCSFEDSLELLEVFGFPSVEVCPHPEEIRRLSKNILLDLEMKRRIALLSVTSDSLYVECVAPAAQFTAEEITRVLDFNREHFGVKHSKSFLRDLRKHYREKGFFVLGKA